MGQEGTPYLIPFGAHGMVAHPNRWQSRPGEMTLAENVVVENDMLQKEPSTAYYDQVGLGLLSLSGSATLGQTLTTLDLFPASATAAFVANTVTLAISPAGAIWVISLTGSALVGELHAVALSREAGTGGASAMTDSRGNVYTNVHTATGSTMQIELWVSLLTFPLTGGVDTLTVIPDDPTADLAVIASRYSGVTSTTPLAQTFVADAAGAFSTPSISSNDFPLLAIGVTAATDPASVITFTGYTSVGNISFNHITVQASRFDQGHRGIQAQFDWDSSATNSPAGTVSITEGLSTVAGAGTVFLTAYRPGDEIMVSGETQRVDTITSNTALTIVDRWSTTGSGLAHVRRAGPVLITSLVGRVGGVPVGGLVKELPENGAQTNRGDLNFVTLTTALNPAPQSARFVVGGKEVAANNRKLFFFNGVDPVQVAMSGDGNLAAAIANPAADWGAVANPQTQPINGIVHQDSLMAFGNWNDPHRLYVSSATDHEDFRTAPTSTGITIRIASQIGIRLYGAATYQGVLFLFKYPNGVFYLDDTPIDRLQWGYRIRSASVGCAPSPHAVLSIDDDVLLCDPNGHFHLLSAVDTLGGTRDSDMTRQFGLQNWTKEHVDTDSLDQIVSVYDPQTKTAWFGLHSQEAKAAGLVQNDLIIRWDFSKPGGPARMTTARVWQPHSLAIKRRNWTGTHAPIIGETANAWFVNPGSYGTRTNRDFINAQDVAVGIDTRVDLPEMDFDEDKIALRHVRKRYVAMEVVAEAENFTQPFAIELRLDGVLKQTVNIQQTNVRRILKTLQCGDGYTITARCITDGSVAGDLPLLGILFYYIPLGTDHSRKS